MQRASVVAGRAAQVDLEVVRGELVKGRVVDAESSQPVAGVSIQWGEGVSGPPTVAATKEDGTFELRVAPGSVDLRIADVPKGYVPPEEPTTVQVVPDEGATGVELKILRGVSLAGRVVGPNGQAVPQAQVRTDDWQILATADEQGQFSLDGLAPGRSLRVWVSAPKQGWSGEATVKAQKGAKPLTLKLGPAAQVEVRVVDREGKPIPKPHVYAMMGVSVDGSTSYRGGLGFETRQDGKGTCTVVGLLSSHHYYVSASAEGYGSAQTPPFILKAGEKKKLSPLVLRKADAVLTGRVTDPSGKPVAGAVVQSSGRPATTDEQGRYRIENLVHGQGAYVRVSHPNYEEDYQYNVDPDAGPVNLVLTPKFIPAKVLAKPGEPAPELACAHWLNSERLTWKKLEGKVVLLAFSAAGAGPCERLLPTLQDLHERHAAQGFTVLQVQDRSLPLGELRTWVQKRSLSYPVAMVQSGLYDGWASETFQNYGVQAVPMLFLIDRAGILHPVESMAGLSEQVEKLLAER
jgi:protocatechuate 3,4-dioxygenase beta subunit/peroxiredoxin